MHRFAVFAISPVLACFAPQNEDVEPPGSDTGESGSSSSDDPTDADDSSTAAADDPTAHESSSATTDGDASSSSSDEADTTSGERGCDPAPELASALPIAGPTSEGLEGADVDGAGNVVITIGYDTSISLAAFGGVTHPTAGLADSIVVKLAPDGGLVWAQTLAGGGGDYGGGVRFKPDGDVVFVGSIALAGGAGTIAGEPIDAPGGAAFVAILDESTGHLEDYRLFGTGVGGVPNPVDVAVDPSGDVWIVGRTDVAFDFGPDSIGNEGGVDAFVVRLADDLTPQMGRAFGGPGEDIAYGVEADGQGGAYVAGRYAADCTIGAFDLINHGAADGFIAHVGALGTPSWAAGFGGAGSEATPAIDVDANGGVVLVGNITGDVDFGGGVLSPSGTSDGFIASFDAEEGHRWSRTLGSPGSDEVNGVTVGADGDVLVTGRIGVGDLGCGEIGVESGAGYVARFDATDGTTRANVWFATTGAVSPGFVAESDGGLALAGRFTGAWMLDDPTEATGYDVFVGRLE
jgi:hypothetical protein